MSRTANRIRKADGVDLPVDEAVVPPRRFSLSAMVKTTLVVLVVAYVAAYLASRTSGFRSRIESYLEDRLGMPVRIGSARATWQLDVVLKDVVSGESGRVGKAGFSAEEAVLRWSPVRFGKPRPGSARRTLSLKHCRLSFAPGESGGWEPAVFDRVRLWLEKWGGFVVRGVGQESSGDAAGSAGSARKPGAPSRLKPDFWERMNLSIADGNVVWWGRDGSEIASADGIDFHVTPVWLPKRKMIHYLLNAEVAEPAPGRSVRDFTLELLRAGSNEIVLAYTGEWSRGMGSPDKGGRETVSVVQPGPEGGALTDDIRRELEAAAE